MTSKKQSDKGLSNPALYVVLALFATLPMGLLGAFIGYNSETSNALTGFLWGIAIAVSLCLVMVAGYIGWDWLKKDANEGRLRPYMIGGLIAAIAISGWFAWGLGDPTCIESTDPDGRPTTCLEYADDGFEATPEQRWSEFWSKLPVTLLICLLIAYIAYSQVEKNRPKHFRSEEDNFSVGIFPETIGVSLDEDGNSYKYSPSYGPKYTIDVTQLENFPSSSHKALGVVESWHRNIVSAATKVPADKVDYEEGEKQDTPYLYGSYPLKKDTTYYHLTLVRYGKIYSLSMYIQSLEHENKSNIDKIFSEFIDSFELI